jgi:hypothetical protein
LGRAGSGSLAFSFFLLLQLLVISPQLRAHVWRGGWGGACRHSLGGASDGLIAVSLLPLLLQSRHTPRLPRTGQQTSCSLLLRLPELLKGGKIRVL